MKLQDTFFKNEFDLGLMFLMEHTIDVYGRIPIKQAPWIRVAFASEGGENDINPYKPSVIFVGHRQTGQTQIRRRILGRLIRVSTVCIQNVLLKFE